MNPQLETDLPEISVKNLDDATRIAFEAIGAKGFKPFLVFGPSPLALISSRISGTEPGSVLQVAAPREDYTAVLVATNPSYTIYTISETHVTTLAMGAAGMVPNKMKGVDISCVVIHG
jgi:hypothetical protein